LSIKPGLSRNHVMICFLLELRYSVVIYYKLGQQENLVIYFLDKHA